MINNRFIVRAALAVALVCVAVNLIAAEVSTNDAAIAAKAWVDLGRSMGKIPTDRAVASVEPLEDASTGARLLVAKFEGGGFVVMSADDLVDPVISFSPTGDGIDTSDANPYWALLRGDIAAREAAAGVTRTTTSTRKLLASSSSSSSQTSAQKKWAELLGTTSSSRTRLKASSTSVTPSDIRVDSFVESRWSQLTACGMNCYNYYTPNNYVCGCVATAGAQIMRYYQYPTASVTAKTFTCAVSGTKADYTMKGGTYDWSSMPLVPANGVTEAQCQAIGKLTYDIGVTVGMAWASGGSSSAGYDLSTSLTNVFGYANAVAAFYISGYYEYSLDEVKKVVIPNCDARCPMLMSVSGAERHAVLVDGYGYTGDDFCMHVNLGWAGSGDAWYCPPNIESFNVINGFVFNIFTNSTGSILSGRVLDSSGAPISGADVTLKRGSTLCGSTTTDPNGIYAFIASEGTYLVTASANSESAMVGASVSETVGTRLAGDGSYYYSTAVIGNSYGNDIAITGVASVVPPVFSPESCTFYPSTNVTISCVDSDAWIRYTLDGSNPDDSSTIYVGPITVDDTVTIKAQAYKTGCNPSAVTGATYTYDSSKGVKGDDFADPIKISGTNGTYVIADNSDYTVESEEEEPKHTKSGSSFYNQYRTIWYKWTAPGSGTMTFKTSAYDSESMYWTCVAVYTGNSLSSITRKEFATVPDDDDDEFGTQLSLEVTQGVTYRIVGMNTLQDAVTFTLKWSGNLTVTQTAYEAWASANGVGESSGTTCGISNVFRYIFDKPAESFSTISDIGYGTSGLVLTIPVVNTTGVTLSVLSTTNLTDWTSSAVTERPVTVDTSGNVTFDDSDPSRFYRLKAKINE